MSSKTKQEQTFCLRKTGILLLQQSFTVDKNVCQELTQTPLVGCKGRLNVHS